MTVNQAQSELFTPVGGVVKVLTVKQPWAWAIIHAGKDVENRSWSTSFRGQMLIHAGRKIDPDGVAFLESIGVDVPAEALIGGMIVGSVQVADCIRRSDSQWAQLGAWHWLLDDPQPATASLECRGQMGLFGPPSGWELAFK